MEILSERFEITKSYQNYKRIFMMKMLILRLNFFFYALAQLMRLVSAILKSKSRFDPQILLFLIQINKFFIILSKICVTFSKNIQRVILLLFV